MRVVDAKRLNYITALTLGRRLLAKTQRQADAVGGVYRAARNLRKQGVSLELALAALVYSRPRKTG